MALYYKLKMFKNELILYFGNINLKSYPKTGTEWSNLSKNKIILKFIWTWIYGNIFCI
jgi:hypothetical protein